MQPRGMPRTFHKPHFASNTDRRFQLRSRHWRIRSLLVYINRENIERFFNIKHLDPSQVRDQVSCLLEQDRCTCANREVRSPQSKITTLH